MFCPTCGEEVEGSEAECCNWHLEELSNGDIRVTSKVTGDSFTCKVPEE